MKEKYNVCIDKNKSCGRDAIIFFTLAIVFRALGIIKAGTMSRYQLTEEIVLPMVFCALIILCIIFFGKSMFRLSLIPLAGGALFFILREMSEDNILGRILPDWEIALRIAIYIGVYMLFSFAVLREYRIKWAIVSSCGLGFLYHIIFEGYPAIVSGGDNISFSSIMMEISILFILLGLLFTALGLKLSLAAEPEKERTDGRKQREKKQGTFWSKLFRKTKKEAAENSAAPAPVKPEKQPETENHPEPEEKPEPEESIPVSAEASPVIDSTFFEKPYKDTLTLDPAVGSGKDDKKESDQTEE